MPSLASARKTTFGSAVSCKWTRQLRHLESINSSGRLNGGLFRHSISYMASVWRRNTTDTPTLHFVIGLTMSVTLLREGGKYYRKCKLFKSFRDVYLRLSQKIDPLLNLLGKWTYKLLVEKIGTNLTDTPVVSIFLFPRAVIKQFINWPMNKIFWNTVRNLPFFRVQIKGGQSRVNKLAHIQIVNKLSLYYWSQWIEFARCAYGVIHAWHFPDVTCTSTWSVWGSQI